MTLKDVIGDGGGSGAVDVDCAVFEDWGWGCWWGGWGKWFVLMVKKFGSVGDWGNLD